MTGGLDLGYWKGSHWDDGWRPEGFFSLPQHVQMRIEEQVAEGVAAGGAAWTIADRLTTEALNPVGGGQPRCPNCHWFLKFRRAWQGPLSRKVQAARATTAHDWFWEAYCWNDPEVCPKDAVAVHEADFG